MIKDFFAADGTTIVQIEETQAAALGLRPATKGADLGEAIFKKAIATKIPIEITDEEYQAYRNHKTNTFGSFVTELPVDTVCTAKPVPGKSGNLTRLQAGRNGRGSAYVVFKTIEPVNNGKPATFNFSREGVSIDLTADSLLTFKVEHINGDETARKVFVLQP